MIKQIVVKTGTGMLNAVYSVMKLAPQKRRVVILSRQSNEPSLDIRLLAEELRARDIPVRVLCDKMGGGISGVARYIGPLFRQMGYLATSTVAVLDSYCIPACVFPHRKGLTVIQMWHALGAMKKFSKSILDKPEGKSSAIAELMKMHEGYDHIFTSSEKARPAFAEAFGYPPEKLTIMSLPRVDVIMDKSVDRENRDRILADHPVLAASGSKESAGSSPAGTGNGTVLHDPADKERVLNTPADKGAMPLAPARRETILYAPTLRIGRDMTQPTIDLIRATDTDRYNLIISMHPLTEITLPDDLPENVIIDGRYSSTEYMAAADYVVTDYSAITYDAALKGLPLYFYAFDKDEYLEDREFYLDYDRDMPGPICSSAAEIAAEIGHGDTAGYRQKALRFADLYIEKKENCTAEIADFIETFL